MEKTTDPETPATDIIKNPDQKQKAPKPPKKPNKPEAPGKDKDGVKIIDIPEKRAKRIQEINEEFARQRVSYDTRMHEILVGICDDLDIPQDMRAQYTPDFKSIIVQKERKAPPSPLEPK
jgi:hypothetical protein